jgi:hypothetical protein
MIPTIPSVPSGNVVFLRLPYVEEALGAAPKITQDVLAVEVGIADRTICS